MLASEFHSLAVEGEGVPGELRDWLREASDLLLRCATAGIAHGAFRCEKPFCPRCEARKAVRYRRRMEVHLRGVGAEFALVTVTLAADDLREDYFLLKRSFTALRRSVAWSAVASGGEGHLHVKPSDPGGCRAFNLHFHAVVELVPGLRLDPVALGDRWRSLLADQGRVGSLDVQQPIRNHWAVIAGEAMAPRISKVAFYVSARKAKELRFLTADQLGAVLRFLPGQRRVVSFGTWRKSPRPSSTKVRP
jgi:hypothetical protein